MRTNGTHLGTVRHELARAAGHATPFITRVILTNLHVRTRQIFWGRKPHFGGTIRQGSQNICAMGGICNVKIGWIKRRSLSPRVWRKCYNVFRLRRHVTIKGSLCFSPGIREGLRSQQTRKPSKKEFVHSKAGRWWEML